MLCKVEVHSAKQDRNFSRITAQLATDSDSPNMPYRAGPNILWLYVIRQDASASVWSKSHPVSRHQHAQEGAATAQLGQLKCAVVRRKPGNPDHFVNQFVLPSLATASIIPHSSARLNRLTF